MIPWPGAGAFAQDSGAVAMMFPCCRHLVWSTSLKPACSPEPHGKKQEHLLQCFYVDLASVKSGLPLKPLSLLAPKRLFCCVIVRLLLPRGLLTVPFCELPGLCHLVGEGSKFVRFSSHFANSIIRAALTPCASSKGASGLCSAFHL